MSEPKVLYVLLAPSGQLSGNGQLRETVIERRRRNGEDVPFWYLTPQLVEDFNLPVKGADSEAVVAEDRTAINWLKLRFGGESFTTSFDISKLREQAMGLPPEPTIRDISAR